MATEQEMADTLRMALLEDGIDLSHSRIAEIVARQMGEGATGHTLSPLLPGLPHVR